MIKKKNLSKSVILDAENQPIYEKNGLRGSKISVFQQAALQTMISKP
jgi:hypothetical protein